MRGQSKIPCTIGARCIPSHGSWLSTALFKSSSNVAANASSGIANRDDHAKNVSFLLDGKGQWRLAPAYDLTFSFGPGGEQSMMVMGEGKVPGVIHLRALAAKHDVKNADAIITRVQSAVSQWRADAEQAGVTKKSAAMIERALAEIAKRDAPPAPKPAKPKKAKRR